MRTPSAGPLREAFLLAVAFTLLALGAVYLARQPGSIATVWVANAVAVGFLVTAPRSRWPTLLAAAGFGNLAANLLLGDGLMVSAAFSLANLAEVLAGAWLVRRHGGVERMTDGARMFLPLVALGALLPQLLGATLGALVLDALHFARFERVWLDWYIGSALGAVLTMPLVIAMRQAGFRLGLRSIATPTFVALAMLTVGIALVALPTLPYPFIYLSMPLIAGAFLVPALPLFLLCFLLGVTTTAALDFGLFTPPAFTASWQHVLVYVPALLCVLPAQLLAVGLTRDRALTNTLASLNSGTADLMIMFDMDGIVRAVNAAWLAHIGRTSAEVLGRSFLQSVPPKAPMAEVQDRVNRSLRGEFVSARITSTFFDGQQRTLDVSYRPAYGSDGQRSGSICTAHDVTALVQAQADLQQRMNELRTANESLEQFARIASHDLREPLNTIVQFSDLIEQDHGAALEPVARRHFGHVRQGAARLRTMLDDMLQFARLQQPGDVELGPVDLGPTVAQAVQALDAGIRERDAQVVLDALPAVIGHPSLYSLLFQNLVSNAVKFVPADRRPEVRITARTEAEGHVVVSVADNGIGIAAEDLPRLFEPFRRLHSRRKFEGTGLGLTICRRIVDLLGGEISIASTPGEGSRVDVKLKAV